MYSTDFRNLCLSRTCWGWAFGWKVCGAQVFYFCNAKVKTLRMDNIGNFASFNLYPVPAKIPYLQKYSTDFRNLCLTSNMLSLRIWVESFWCAGILLLEWQSENISHRQHLKFCRYQPVHCASKILYLQTYSTDFRSLCLTSNMLSLGIWVESFWCAGILLFQWQGENLAHGQHLKFCNFQPVPCASKNPISPKIFNRFSKSLPQLEDVEGGHLREKFQLYKYFTFGMARWRICGWTTFDILQLSICTLCQQKSHISKGIKPISEILASARRCWGWAFGWNVSSPQVFYFTMARWKQCASKTFSICPLLTRTRCQQKSYISKGIQPILEMFASARICWGWAFGKKVSGAQVINFCKVKVKT